MTDKGSKCYNNEYGNMNSGNSLNTVCTFGAI